MEFSHLYSVALNNSLGGVRHMVRSDLAILLAVSAIADGEELATPVTVYEDERRGLFFFMENRGCVCGDASLLRALLPNESAQFRRKVCVTPRRLEDIQHAMIKSRGYFHAGLRKACLPATLTGRLQAVKQSYSNHMESKRSGRLSM